MPTKNRSLIIPMSDEQHTDFNFYIAAHPGLKKAYLVRCALREYFNKRGYEFADDKDKRKKESK